MDKYDMLMIRACKANVNVLRRLRRIWQHRCGLPTGYTSREFDGYLAYHLMELIVDEGLDVKQFIHKLCTSEQWEFNFSGMDKDDSTHDRLARISSHLRNMRVDKFPFYISPAKFKNK